MSNYEITSGHVFAKHKQDGPCIGCRRAEGLDCMYESLGFCTVCGGIEGSLLPKCPGKWLAYEEHEENYKHYCNSTGPFAESGGLSR